MDKGSGSGSICQILINITFCRYQYLNKYIFNINIFKIVNINILTKSDDILSLFQECQYIDNGYQYLIKKSTEKLYINIFKIVRGCPLITSAAGGEERVSQMLMIADEGGRGGKPNADDC